MRIAENCTAFFPDEIRISAQDIRNTGSKFRFCWECVFKGDGCIQILAVNAQKRAAVGRSCKTESYFRRPPFYGLCCAGWMPPKLTKGKCSRGHLEASDADSSEVLKPVSSAEKQNRHEIQKIFGVCLPKQEKEKDTHPGQIENSLQSNGTLSEMTQKRIER